MDLEERSSTNSYSTIVSIYHIPGASQDRASFGAFLKNGVTEMKNMLDDYLVAVGKDDELADMDWDETIEPLTAPLPSLLLLPAGSPAVRETAVNKRPLL